MGALTDFDPQSCAVFFKTRELYGELSNMRSGFPLEWEGWRVWSSEALYQAHKFFPETRVVNVETRTIESPFHIVLAQTNPMVSKMKAKKYAGVMRTDFHDIKLDIMNYCVRLKYLQHREAIDRVLDDTMGMPIVEKSRRDRLWGAVNNYRGFLEGMNLLGGLWDLINSERGDVVLPTSILPDNAMTYKEYLYG